MSKYSLGAYRIAVRARSNKTIMVEGKDDKELFVTLKLVEPGAAGLVIDSADILDDPSISRLGNKAKIDALISSIPNLSPIVDKLRCVVDREWEDLVDINTLAPVPWTPSKCTVLRCATSGHSIENYQFSPQFVTTYLQHFGEGVAHQTMVADVLSAVPELIRLAAAFSEVARIRQLIGRAERIVEWADLVWNGATVALSPLIDGKLAGRGALLAAGFEAAVTAEYLGKWSSGPLSVEAHHHAHGHLGEGILWAGVASIAVAHGHTPDVAREIATGRKDEKRRVWHRWLVAGSPGSVAPLTQVFR